MRTWRRLGSAVRCGRCNGSIPTGAPVLELRLVAVTLYRCGGCAPQYGETAPAAIDDSAPLDVPQGIEHQASFGLTRQLVAEEEPTR